MIIDNTSGYRNYNAPKPSEFEALKEGSLSAETRNSIELHTQECELCREAVEGLGFFSNAREYNSGMEDLQTKWLVAKRSHSNNIHKKSCYHIYHQYHYQYNYRRKR